MEKPETSSTEREQILKNVIRNLYHLAEARALEKLLTDAEIDQLVRLGAFNAFGKKFAQISKEAIIVIIGNELLTNPTSGFAAELFTKHLPEIVEKILEKLSYTKDNGVLTMIIDGESFI